MFSSVWAHVLALCAWLIAKVEAVLFPLVEANLVPDFLLRIAIRSKLAAQLKELDLGSPVANVAAKIAYVKDLKTRPIAESTADANKQRASRRFSSRPLPPLEESTVTCF